MTSLRWLLLVVAMVLPVLRGWEVGPENWWGPAHHHVADPWGLWGPVRPRPEAATTGFGHGHLAWPVVVRLGPVVEAPLVHHAFTAFPLRGFLGGPPFGLAELEGFQRDLPSLLDSFAGRLGQAVQAGGFQVEREAGNFKLRASLPGYEMQEGEQGEQPLSVKVLGRSLVVKGRKRDGRMVSTFQRSFRLPEAADADRIAVTYNKADGALAVDIPPKPGVETKDEGVGLDEWAFDSQDGGSHTTVVVSSGHLADMPSVVDELRDIMAEPFAPLFGGRKAGPTPVAGAEGAGAKETQAAPVPESPPVGEATQEAASAQQAPGPAPTPESVADTGPAVLVQPNDARAFWRIGEAAAGPEGPSIEVVAPQGFEVGKPQGQQVPVYSRAGPEAQRERTPVGQVELPVLVTDEDCTWAEGGVPGERVLQCKIKGEAVKKVHIKVADEL